MKRICAELSEQIVEAIVVAGEAQSAVAEGLPCTAENLIDDMEPRLAIVGAV